MKKLITVIFLLGIFCGSIKAGENKNPLMASDTVVWAGLDYSMMRMIGSDDPQTLYNFIVPDFHDHSHFRKMFPDMPEKWNQLFLDEKIDAISSIMQKEVETDIDGVTERNKSVTTNQIIITSDLKEAIQATNITPQDIANEVRSYKMENTNGLGLVFIVDKLVGRYYVHPAASGSISQQMGVATSSGDSSGTVYIVFFDVATREVISIERQTHHVSTAGNFLNFYFGPIKDTASTLGKYRVSSYSTAPTRRR